MSTQKGGFTELLFSTIMPKVYGIGAAVVIVGALFKIQHYPGAGMMLGVGLTVEAIIFFLSAFEPKHPEPDWSRVYPELSDDYEAFGEKKAIPKATGSTSQQLDQMMDKAKIGPELIDSLGKGMKNMADSASKMSNLSDAAVATNDYANNVKQASKSLLDMNKSYATTVTAMQEMSNASKDAKEYHSQVQSVTKNLSALNAVYEMELQDSNQHLKSMKKFYENLGAAFENLSEAGKGTEAFKSELSRLTTNLTSLNRVYGSMLSAMRGGSGNGPQQQGGGQA
ncbi:MAG: gliding motility protein GldL [Bacteroidetes bacterium]|nr:gliding motility protein GldL [Bacteroidota bacterium]